MRKLFVYFLVFVMSIGFVMPMTPVQATQSQPDWEIVMNRSLDFLRDAVVPNPLVGSVGGEWAVLALARAERVTASDPWITAWLSDLERTLTEVDRITAEGHDIQHPPSSGTFPGGMRRWTDFQRVTLALSSLGLDATNFNGRDLTTMYNTFIPVSKRHALNMTINVDTFALIALDTKPYSGDRDQFIQWLLEESRPNGTWGLGSFDLDVTIMAAQSLARYYHGNPEVRVALDRTLEWLFRQTAPDPESTAQMIVLLTALGPDFTEEASYYVNWLLRWFDEESGGFRRPTPNSPVNHMATEQAAYALVAYWRFVNGMTHLYDMSDMFDGGSVEIPTLDLQTGVIGLPNRHPDVRPTAITFPTRTFADVHTNRAAVEALASRGIINGRTETTFDPDATMTRAEFAAIITRGLNLPDVTAMAFNDVATNAWYFGAVGTAFFYEIVNGISDAVFNPNGTITRQEAAVIISRAARLIGMNTELGNIEILNMLAPFGDYRYAANWAWEALAFAYRESILDDNEFYIRPLEPATRGEIAEMLYQLLTSGGLI
ncbi:MAG: S-layer homology domain-containing protein [Defluviitaleaceae bacterium]|nr:S-layer homology domain-containing protein [Defluviitaleaceae bacterium]